MQFLNPSAFYLLTLIPIVALLHFLKLRRQRYIAPSVMLWLEAIEDMKANVPFQRLRNSLLPPLQILFLLIAICGIARPALLRPGALANRLMLIVDTSASMAATDDGTNRLDEAKVKAASLIDRLDPEGQMMLMDTAQPPYNIRQGFTSDKALLRQALADLSVQHTSSDLNAVFGAARVYADAPNTQIFFVSDKFENLPPTPIQTISVGTRRDNIGVVQFNVARGGNQYHILAEIQSFADVQKQFKAILELDGNWYYDETVILPPGARQSVLFSVNDEGFNGQSVAVRLDLDDALAVDNVASGILQPTSSWEVLLVSDRRQPLLNAMLTTHPRVRLHRIPTQAYHGEGDKDIIIFDRFTPEVIPEGNMIFINPIDGLPFMPVREITQPTRVINQDSTHEVMRQVSLIDLAVKASLRCELPVWGVSLVETPLSPLIWLGEQGARRVVVFAFDAFQPEVSDFAFFEKSIASPLILMSQCLEWLGSATEAITPRLVKTGEPVKIRLGEAETTAQVMIQLPDGAQRNLGEKSARLVFTETTQAGVYTVLANNQPVGKFAANLLDPKESDLTPTQLPEDERPSSLMDEAYASSLESRQEIWQYAAALALLLLIVEWWAYHRRY